MRLLENNLETEFHKVRMKLSDRQLKKLMDSIKDWYRQTYPKDDIYTEMRPYAKFIDVVNALDGGRDVYKTIFVNYVDSGVREEVFTHISEIMNVDYDVVYNQWLNTK